MKTSRRLPRAVAAICLLLAPSAFAQDETQPLTAEEMAALRQQIVACWSAPGDVTGTLPAVRLRFSLDRDGSLLTSPEPRPEDVRDDPAYRAVLGAAQRAIARCMPLRNLPPEKYRQWQHVDMVFNPQFLPGR